VDLLVLLVFFFAAAPAAVGETKAGKQFLTFGMQMTPGFVYDSTHPEGTEMKSTAVIGGGALTLGLQHATARNLFMSGELEAGVLWLDDHTLSRNGIAASETAPAWGAGILGRWIARGDEGGPEAGLGLHYWRAALSDGPLTVISFDLRAGWYFWPTETEFLLAEVGYRFPFIEGIDLPTNFGSGENEEVRELDAWLHRFSIGFSYGY
jgi:hypothetical protein